MSPEKIVVLSICVSMVIIYAINSYLNYKRIKKFDEDFEKGWDRFRDPFDDRRE